MGKEKASALCERRETRDSRPPPGEHARAGGKGTPDLSSPPSSLLSFSPSLPPSQPLPTFEKILNEGLSGLEVSPK
jgi:hypothetical protein